MKEIVEEWVERGNHDLEAAKLLLSEEGYFDVVLFHIHQAVEKYLKGYLICNGWKLKKIHDIEALITEVVKFDVEFQEYLDFSRRLTAYYYEERYPPGPPPDYSKKEVEKTMIKAHDLITRIKEKVERCKK